MFCIHCKHCPDDVFCSPASSSSEPVDEYRDQLHEHYEEVVEGASVNDLPRSAIEVIPPVVIVPEVIEIAEGPPAPHAEPRVRTRIQQK